MRFSIPIPQHAITDRNIGVLEQEWTIAESSHLTQEKVRESGGTTHNL